MSKNVHEIEIKLEKEWKEALDKAFKKKVKDTKIDGFRKGNIPKEMYLKRFGIESLYMDAVDFSVNEAYKKLLEKEKLVPAIEPSVDVKDIKEDYIIFKFKVITRPEVKLGEYKNLGIKLEKAKVTDKEIKEEIEKLQLQMADLVVKKGKIEEKDIAIIDFEGYVDGELLKEATGANYSLEIGSKQFIPGFEEGLIGHKKGDKVTLNLKFPEEYVENLKGKDVRFEVTIVEVKSKKMPKVDEEFFKDMGYKDIKTLEEFKKEIKKNLEASKNHTLEDEYIEKCLDKAASNMTVEINKEIIDEEIHRMISEYDNRLKSQGLSIEKYYEITGQTHEDLHKQMDSEAVKRVKYRYLIEEVAKKEDIKFTDKEVEKEAKKIADNYGISVDELIKAYGSIDIVKYDMQMHRALEIIKDNKKEK